jgi:hypothetical protein
MRKVGDVGHSVRPIMTKGLQLFLVLMRGDDHDVWPDVKFVCRGVCFPGDIRNPGANVHVRDADPIDMGLLARRLCLTQLINAGSKQPGSSCEYPGKAGRHVQSFVPVRRTRYSPPSVDGQSRMVASLVMKEGPALKASAIFSASVAGSLFVAIWRLLVRAEMPGEIANISARMSCAGAKPGHRDLCGTRLSSIRCSSSGIFVKHVSQLMRKDHAFTLFLKM